MPAPPGTGLSAAAAVPAPKKHPIRIASVVGALASALWLVAYFLPWITFTPVDRQRMVAHLGPEIDDLRATHPEDADRLRIILDQIDKEGWLGGLDLFHYSRTAYAFNRGLQGRPPSGEEMKQIWVIQRAWRAVSVLLAVLPLASVALLLLLLARRLSHPGAALKTGLVVAGCLGSALAIAWDRVAESHGWDVLRGPGILVGLTASIAQACAGLFGVSARNWWRVYSTSILLLGGASALAWAYVVQGWTP